MMETLGSHNLSAKIDVFLSARSFAVVGASDDKRKFGHKCFACYLQHDRKAYPVNPTATPVLGHEAFKSLAELPERTESISIITPPAVTEKVVREAVALGIKNIWMQPGAESAVAVQCAEAAGCNVISGGPCLLVALGCLF